MTFSALGRRRAEAVVPTIKASTANYYQKLIRAHILPHFGQQQISTIGRYEVEIFLAEQAKTYSRSRHDQDRGLQQKSAHPCAPSDTVAFAWGNGMGVPLAGEHANQSGHCEMLRNRNW